MQALVVVAHGSRKEASNIEIRDLTSKVSIAIKKNPNINFSYIDYAFLELAQPNIPDGIIKQIKKGATKIVVMPYFLSSGRHITVDIPQEVKIARDLYPEIEIVIADYLGAADVMTDIIIEQATKGYSS